MKRRLIILLMVSVAVVALVGCASNIAAKSDADKKTSEKKTLVHKVSAKELRQRSKAIEEVISGLERVRDDTESISRIATGGALKSMVSQVEGDLKAGKVKVRKLTERKLKPVNVTQNLVGVKLSYTDMSYYVAKSTSETLTKPTGERKEVILAFSLVKGDWKISEIVQVGVKPQK